MPLSGDLAAACGGDGPTVVIDPLWGEPAAAAVEAAAPRARIVHYGQSAGPEATFKSGTVRGKELELLGLSNFARTNEELRTLHGELLAPCKSGALQVDFETFSLDEVDEAWRRQGAGAKAVVALSSAASPVCRACRPADVLGRTDLARSVRPGLDDFLISLRARGVALVCLHTDTGAPRLRASSAASISGRCRSSAGSPR